MPKTVNQEIELELTYLAREIPKEIAGIVPKKLLDIYVPETADRPFIRLRQKGEEYEITKKLPISDDDFSVQTEDTIVLSQEEFEALSVSSHRQVEKDRYFVSIDGHAAEVDVFTGAFQGLVMIDFEFETVQQKDFFKPPVCCLADVTQELFIAGGQLAGKAYADIQANLDRFNFKPLRI